MQEDDSITGINVVPLVDVVLVLLIIFMMTASIIVAPSVDIELPQVSTADTPPSKNLHLLIDKIGTVYLDDKTIQKDQIVPMIRKKVSEKQDIKVLVTADKKVPYGEVIEVLDMVRTGGVTKFAISVEMLAAK